MRRFGISQGLVVATLLAASGICSTAVAEVGVELEPLRSWTVPIAVSPYAAKFDTSVDGAFLMMGSSLDEDDGEEERCLIVVSTAKSALSYEVRHEFEPTRCVDAALLADGDFVVRGQSEEQSTGDNIGFTARIDAEGQMLWSVVDSIFADEDDNSAFLGRYKEPVQGLAYDERGDHVLALTSAKRQLGDQSRELVQAHSIDAERGELVRSGITFGPTNDDHIEAMVARDGGFLVITRATSGEETRFYSHEIGAGTPRFEPVERDWSHREVVVTPEYREDVGTIYVWNGGEEGQYEVLRVQGPDSVAWSTTIEDTAKVDGQLRQVGSPDRMWMSSKWVILRHRRTGHHPYLRILHTSDGEEVAVISKSELTDFDEVELSYGEDGQVVLVAVNPVGGWMWEYEVHLGGAAEAYASTREGDEAGGSCQSLPGNSPGAVVMVLLCAWWVRWAVADCQSPGRALS